VTVGETVRAQLGPVKAAGDPVEIAGYILEPMDAGNPHAVTFVSDPLAIPVDAAGPLVEGDPAFPQRTNVEFATVVSPTRIDLRVWERGAGETLACGSGAAAAVAAAHQGGRTDASVAVHLPGGVLQVEIIDGEAWLEGPANEVFGGTIEI
jgi:diaminopimelate epimerase